MADPTLVETVQNLSDLELAALICLIAQEHCVIDTEPDALDELAEELELVITILINVLNMMLMAYRLQQESMDYLQW